MSARLTRVLVWIIAITLALLFLALFGQFFATIILTFTGFGIII